MVNGNGHCRAARSTATVSARQRAAFLGVLGRSGVVSHAAAEIGVSRAGLYRARKRSADFAAAWDAALASSQVRAHKSGEAWGAATLHRFLEVLAGAGSPAQAAAAAGRTLASAYRARARSPGFARSWTVAQERALDLLEATVDDHALGGVRRTVTRGTETAERVGFSGRLAMFPRNDLTKRFRHLNCRVAARVADEVAVSVSATLPTASRADR